jgi:hypothetical protein
MASFKSAWLEQNETTMERYGKFAKRLIYRFLVPRPFTIKRAKGSRSTWLEGTDLALRGAIFGF